MTEEKVIEKHGNKEVIKEPDYILESFNNIVDEDIEYLWHPYFPKGKFIMIAGDPAVGKTYLTTYIASVVSNGGSFPFSDEKVEKGKVIRQIIKPGTKAPVGTSIGLIVSKGPKAGKYSATYNFAREDLVDENGKQIKSGAVSILLNGAAQDVNPKYSNVAKWPGDYVYKKKGVAQIELLVNGKIVIEDTVNLK